MLSSHCLSVQNKITPALMIGLVLLAFASPIHAIRTYTATWNGLYPASSSGTNAGCALCHLSVDGSGLNYYGDDIATSTAGAISNRIVDVQNVDSDTDPTMSDNLTEINANSQPGWSVSAPSGVIGDLDPATNQAPTADAGGPYDGTVGVAVTFDATASSDTDGTIVQYDWDFGDGSTATDAGPTPEHTYNTAGTYTIDLTVTDNDSDTDSNMTTATIVAPPPPLPGSGSQILPGILQLLLD